MHALVARAPTRIDFGGGWTDVPPYSEREGGFVCNVAITRHATVRLDADPSESSASANDGELLLARTALRSAGLHDVRATLRSDFPLGAGLGGSSAAGVAMMGAVEAWRATHGDSSGHLTPDRLLLDRAALAEASRRVEVEELHVAGGRQDHYAAAFGGALALTFGATTTVRQVALAPDTVRELESRCIVVYTGQSRISGDTISAVLNAYLAGEARVLYALARMKALAASMAGALAAGEVDALGALVGEHWAHQRALHPAITTPLIDRILESAAFAGALGGKALGASGGGCVVVIAARGAVAPVRQAVAALATPLPFAIDHDGFAWWPDGSARSASPPHPHSPLQST